MKILRISLIAVIALGFCWSSGLAQESMEEDSSRMANSNDLTVEVKLQEYKLAIGQLVKGVCSVANEDDQTKYSFEIYRKVEQHNEDIFVTTGAHFQFAVNAREEAENLFCKVTGPEGVSESDGFSLDIITEPSLHVRWMTRNATSTALICELVPRPQNMAHFRFRWVAPNGRQISNGPVALVPSSQLHGDGANGFVCESFDLKTRRQLKAGLQISPLRPIQGSSQFKASIKRTGKLDTGRSQRLECSLDRTPSGQVFYSWKFRNLSHPTSGPVLSIDSLNSRNVGTYICVASFTHQGSQLTAMASEILTIKKRVKLLMNTPSIEIDESLQLTCTIQNRDNFTAAQIIWKFLFLKNTGGMSQAVPIIDGQGSFQITTLTDSESRLTKLTPMGDEDVGFYYCTLPDKDVIPAQATVEGLNWQENSDPGTVEIAPICELTCKINGACYNHTQVCDSNRDCPDGEDEASCQCDPAFRRCRANRQGIPATKPMYNTHWECDGENDCGNNYDEEDCSPHKQVAHCPSGNQTQYRCRSGGMIPLAYVCDGAADCPGSDADDEQLCYKNQLMVTAIGGREGGARYVQNVTVYQGQPLKLECESMGNPPPRIIWRKQWRCLPGQTEGQSQTDYMNDKPMGVNWKVESTASCQQGMPRTRGTFTINSVQKQDEGIYNCEALHGQNRHLSSDFVVLVY